MIEDDIREGLLGAFPAGFMLILANGNGPRPAGMYGTVRVETSSSAPAHVSRPSVNLPSPSFGQRQLAAHHAGQVEVQVFGEGSYDVLTTVVLMLDSIQAMEAAELAGVVFGTTQRVDHIPALRDDSEYESRAVASIPFSYTRRVIEPVPVIETVEGSVSVSGAPPATFRSHHGEN